MCSQREWHSVLDQLILLVQLQRSFHYRLAACSLSSQFALLDSRRAKITQQSGVQWTTHCFGSLNHVPNMLILSSLPSQYPLPQWDRTNTKNPSSFLLLFFSLVCFISTFKNAAYSLRLYVALALRADTFCQWLQTSEIPETAQVWVQTWLSIIHSLHKHTSISCPASAGCAFNRRLLSVSGAILREHAKNPVQKLWSSDCKEGVVFCLYDMQQILHMVWDFGETEE